MKSTRKWLAFVLASGAFAAMGTEVLNVNFYPYSTPAGYSGLAMGADNCTRVTNSCWTTVSTSGSGGNRTINTQSSIKDCWGNSWSVNLTGKAGDQATGASNANIGMIGNGRFLYKPGQTNPNVNFTLTGIPFTKYDLVLYLSSYQDNDIRWCAVKVGEKYYIPDPANPYKSISEGVTNATPWGCSKGGDVSQFQLAFGCNAIVIDGLTNSTAAVTMTAHLQNNQYAGIFGFQVVNRGEIIVPDSAALNFTSNTKITEGFKGSQNVCANNCELDLTQAAWTNFTGKFTTSGSGKLVLAAGREPDAGKLDTETIAEVVIQLDPKHMVEGYTTGIGCDQSKIKFRAPDGTEVCSGSKTYTPEICSWSDSAWTSSQEATNNCCAKLTLSGDTDITTINSLSGCTVSNLLITGSGKLLVTNSGTLNVTGEIVLDGSAGLMADPAKLTAPVVRGTAGTEEFVLTVADSANLTNAVKAVNCTLVKQGAGTLTLSSAGYEIEDATVRLEGGLLRIGGKKSEGDGVEGAEIKNATFVYVPSNGTTTAAGELTCNGSVTNNSTVTFIVPTNSAGAAVVGKAFVGQNLSGSGGLVKQGGGVLELGIYRGRNIYSGITLIEEGAVKFMPEGGDNGSNLTSQQGMIAGGGKVMLGKNAMGFSKRNIHSGGTEICTNADLRLTYKYALGSGLTTIHAGGKLALKSGSGYEITSPITGPGVLTHDSGDTTWIKFSGDGTIVASRDYCIDIVGNITNSVKFDVTGLCKHDRSKIKLVTKREDAANKRFPETLSDEHFVGGRPKGWYSARTDDGVWLYSAGLMLLCR